MNMAPAPESLGSPLRLGQNCRVRAKRPPLGTRPAIQARTTLRIPIVGEAPRTRVHAPGIAWSDASGERLRHWMAIDSSVSSDEHKVSIMPMGCSYPSRRAASANLPPRRECAPLWHSRLLAHMPQIEPTSLIGGHAQARFPRDVDHASVTATTLDCRTHEPRIVPMWDPSPRNVAWFKSNPWSLVRRRRAAGAAATGAPPTRCLT